MNKLPVEILCHITNLLDSLFNLILTCRDYYTTIGDPAFKANWFIAKYGLAIALHMAVFKHGVLLDQQTAEALIDKGAVFSRYTYQCLWQGRVCFGYFEYIKHTHLSFSLKEK